MRRIYCDHAASTPLRKEVARAMAPYAMEKFGNASSLHSFGQEAIAAIDNARATFAALTGVQFRDVIFTGSATEANNLALRGAVKRFRETHSGVRPRIIVSALEHESVLETAQDLAREGVELITIPVDARGVIDHARLGEALNERTVLVSVMYVNNEMGAVQSLRTIAALLQEWRDAHQCGAYPLFHTDAVQAFNYYSCDMRESGADMMTLSGHKMGGPKGVGALCVRERETRKLLAPIITGGGQEFGMRSGTENVPTIVGFARAAALADKERTKEHARLRALAGFFVREITKIIPDATLYGDKDDKGAAPHIVYVVFPGVPIDELLVRFDMAGIAVSSGSACASRSQVHSHVLSALALQEARGIRFSFGKTTTRTELAEVVRRIRVMMGKRAAQ